MKLVYLIIGFLYAPLKSKSGDAKTSIIAGLVIIFGLAMFALCVISFIRWDLAAFSWTSFRWSLLISALCYLASLATKDDD